MRWSRGALNDLASIGAYFEQTSPQYARTVVARLYAAPEVLAEYPQAGRVVSEVGVDHIRELVREGYRVVYVVSGETAEVLAVLHGRQDVTRKLRRE